MSHNTVGSNYLECKADSTFVFANGREELLPQHELNIVTR